MMRVLTAAMLALACWMLAGTVAAQPAVTISPADPSRLCFARDPQVPFFVPGDTGGFFLKRGATGLLRGMDPLGELACDGWVVALSDRRHDYHASDPDTPTSGSDGYWARVRAAASNSASAGVIVDFRVTGALLDEFDATPSLTAESFAARLAQAWSGMPRQTVSFDLPADPAAAVAIRDAIHRYMPRLLAGMVPGELPPPRGALAGWDFVVVTPEAVPPEYRGQVLMPWLRRACGGLPVILRLGRPDFRAQMFWLATGAAGFEHADLPGPGSLERGRDFAALRAAAGTRLRVSDATVGLMPALCSPGCPAAIGAADGVVYMLSPRAHRATVQMPPADPHAAFTGMWYNPERDEMIIQPRAGMPGGAALALRKPDPAPWVYCVSVHPAIGDAYTTMPAIRIDADD